MTATITTVDPSTGLSLAHYPIHSQAEVDEMLEQTASIQTSWASRSFAERGQVIRGVGRELRRRRSELAELMAHEMGKPLAQGEAEADKCAWVCDFYADEAESMLADVERESSLSSAWTVYRPLGTVLAVMPWNFPLWQVLRFAAPTLMAGNTGLLKHASSVTGSALAIEELFVAAGADVGCFRTLVLPSDRINDVIADDRVAAVTLTGSEGAGRAVAKQAGAHLKPSVLELGGSDAYVVLHDAAIEEAAEICADSRLTNSGQSCIAAKRFIVVDSVADEFVDAFGAALRKRTVGHPLAEATDVGPQAKTDLRDELHKQVTSSVDAGAALRFGGTVPDGDGAYYPVTMLDNVEPGMAAFDEELFGPVAAVIRAKSESAAIQLANNSRFGLGGAVFTADPERGREIAALEMETGNCFVNAKVASDPRLPFGGIGVSGYGRELSETGIRAFMNAKTVAVA